MQYENIYTSLLKEWIDFGLKHNVNIIYIYKERNQCGTFNHQQQNWG